MAKADWSALFLEGVEEAVDRAVMDIYSQWGDLDEFESVDFEDLRQEALIFLATRTNLQEPARSGDLGLLHFRLSQDLANHMDSTVRATKPDLTLSLESLSEMEAA